MSDTASASYPIRLGPSLHRRGDSTRSLATSSLVSVKYNFKPPSISPSTSGFLHSPNQSNTQWSLEYNTREGEEDRRGTRSSAQSFQGSQSAAKDVDCVLIWDDRLQSYVLDRVSSALSFKYDRGHTKLSDQARAGLADRVHSAPSRAETPQMEMSALGLELSSSGGAAMDSYDEATTQQRPSGSHQDEHGEEQVIQEGGEEDDDEAEFARQLELGLESFATDNEEKESSTEESGPMGTQRAKTGLGLLEGGRLRDDVITPRGSPYIDRPRGQFPAAKSSLNQAASLSTAQTATSSTNRSTPAVSPASVTNSPRPAGLNSSLSASSTWKPPAQRSNVAIAYDVDDDEGDEESEEDDEEEEDDDEEGEDESEDGDLDAYARQLESSLQG